MENKRAETFNIAVKNSFADYDDIKTITYDNGAEMSAYKELEEMLNCLIYFADPGKPGQRGLNENTNGLLRQYFKKNSDFKKINQKDVDEAVRKLNLSTEKMFGGMTHYEAFFEKKALLHFGLECTIFLLGVNDNEGVLSSCHGQRPK